MPEVRTLPISAEHREFTVKINGQAVERTYQLLSVTVTKAADKISAARLVYLDGAASASIFQASNSEMFIPGNEIEILAGTTSDPVSLFKGIVVRQSIKVRDNVAPQLIAECRHKAVGLTIGRKNTYFTDKTDSDILTAILGNAPVTPDVESTSVTHKQMVQYYSTDWDFLLSRAQANGKMVFTNYDTVTVKAPVLSGSAVCTLLFGATILEIDAEIDARIQQQAVKGVTWDPAQQALIEKEGADPGTLSPGNLVSSDLASVASPDHFHLQQTSLLESEAQSWADAQWLRSKMSQVSGRMKCEGMATVNPGDLVTIAGISDRYNGNVFVTGVRQNFDLVEGWKTHLQFGNTLDLLTEQNEVSAPKAGGLLPGINGLQIGIVISNEDPDNEFRVQVKMPVVDNAGDGTWARIASLDAGDQRGFFFRPEVGDEVVLGFLDDDPRQAVILGMLHSSAKAAPLTGSDDNNEKMYQSRSGMKLHFDDDKKIILIETPAGKKVTLDEDAGELKMMDENGNKIVMSSDGILIQSDGKIEIKAQQDVKVEGLNVEQKASASFKAEGSASAEVSASGSLTLKGAMVQIN
ncbi:MAG: type VI secretion system tip protein VgrG [Bacteroidetes bacterium]|nr:MAG: type VI secretion system tip protein VgrG [Bacteroidota bacterium]